MRHQLIDLLEVQKTDIAIRDLETQRDAVPKKLEEFEVRIASAKEQLSTLTTEHDTLNKSIRVNEGTVHAETNKLRKWERRLNDIRNQREYLALSREVEGSKRANRSLEEQTLELMKRDEELEGEISALQDQVAVDEVDCDTEREEVKSATTALEKQVAELTVKRDGLLDTIPKPLLRRYDAIRSKRMGMGLVAAAEGSCRGCNMRLPPQLFIILQRGNTIEQCPSCNRILYFEAVVAPEAGSVEAGDGAEKSDNSVEASA